MKYLKMIISTTLSRSILLNFEINNFHRVIKGGELFDEIIKRKRLLIERGSYVAASEVRGFEYWRKH